MVVVKEGVGKLPAAASRQAGGIGIAQQHHKIDKLYWYFDVGHFDVVSKKHRLLILIC